MSCDHEWKKSEQHCSRMVTRYQCQRCGRWGFRVWTSDATPSDIKPYSSTSTAALPS